MASVTHTALETMYQLQRLATLVCGPVAPPQNFVCVCQNVLLLVAPCLSQCCTHPCALGSVQGTSSTALPSPGSAPRQVVLPSLHVSARMSPELPPDP